MTKIVAIGAGKGGVGKSTVSANLAVALSFKGWKVGLLDGDIYGPSIPTMMKGEPLASEGSFPVYQAWGVHYTSLGSVMPSGKAAAWRGPMIQKALQHMLTDHWWKNCDILVVDLPPGTGDILISLCQSVDIAGAIVVATHHPVTLADLQRCINFFQILSVPLWGCIQNFSALHCPQCHSVVDFASSRSLDAILHEHKVPLLGQLPWIHEMPAQPWIVENQEDQFFQVISRVIESLKPHWL